MSDIRRTHTREFKIEAVRLVTEKGLRVAQAARDLGIHPTLLMRWKPGTDVGRMIYQPSPEVAPLLEKAPTEYPRTNLRKPTRIPGEGAPASVTTWQELASRIMWRSVRGQRL